MEFIQETLKKFKEKDQQYNIVDRDINIDLNIMELLKCLKMEIKYLKPLIEIKSSTNSYHYN